MRQVLGPGALGRPRGIRWRGKWEGESGWGIHVNPWLIHVNVWQKPLQYCKVISLQLIKINGKKKKKPFPCFQASCLALLGTFLPHFFFFFNWTKVCVCLMTSAKKLNLVLHLPTHDEARLGPLPCSWNVWPLPLDWSVAQLCLSLCDPMNCSMPGFPVHHQLLEFAQAHVH